jgi:hypothetical protein
MHGVAACAAAALCAALAPFCRQPLTFVMLSPIAKRLKDPHLAAAAPWTRHQTASTKEACNFHWARCMMSPRCARTPRSANRVCSYNKITSSKGLTSFQEPLGAAETFKAFQWPRSGHP